MAIDKELLDQLLAGRDPEELFARDGLIDELKKALSERMLSAELDDHLESEADAGGDNRRNGSSKKTMLTGSSKVTLDIPRDRSGTFDPKLIAKYQRRFPDFDAKIISMYARGMTVREIRGHLEELYGIDVSPDLISTVTDAVLETVAEWQGRPLDACYPLVFFDAIRVKIRDEGFVRNKAVYIALGILPACPREGGGHQGNPRHLDRADRRRQVLDARDERAQKPGRRRYPDRRRRWPERLPGRHQRRLSGNGCSNLHRASDQEQHELRVMERSQGDRPVAAQRLPRGKCRCGPGGARRLRGGALGPKISGHRAELAPALGAGHPLLRVQRADPADYIHHERDRGIELEATPCRSHPWTLPG